MAIVSTNVPIDSNGICPNPGAIQSQARRLDLIVYELTPASPQDNIADWDFMLFLQTKQGGSLPLTLGLPGGKHLTALVLPASLDGTYDVDLKIKNSAGTVVVIDPILIIRR